MLAQLEMAVAACADAPVWPHSNETLLSTLDALHDAEQRLAAARLAVVREVDGRALAAKEGAASTAVLIRDRLRVSESAARRMVKLAASLDQLPQLRQACAEGAVNLEQAQVIVDSVHRIPAEAGAQVATKAEAALVGYAAPSEPSALRRLGERVLSHVAPEVAEELERVALERAERQSFISRTFTLSRPDGLGRVRLSGWLDVEGASVVNAALDPLCAPGRLGGFVQPTTVPGQIPDGFAWPTAAGQDPGVELGGQAPVDDRGTGQRRADALVEVCRLALRAGELPDNGGERPQMTVTVGFDALAGQLSKGMLDTGESISAEAIRRLACDAQIIPAVLGGDGQLLDLGQSRRLFTGSIRRALVIRDGGCAFPGCDRPPRWTDGHHIVHWADGGPTNLDNGVLLCGHHHRLIHHSDWEVRLGRDGLPEFLPPEYIDPQRRPRRNIYHQPTPNDLRQARRSSPHKSARRGSDHPRPRAMAGLSPVPV